MNGAATVVTDDLVTLGLADDVVNAVPFAGVRFDATDKGPGDILSDFVDAFVGAATFVVQGLVLIGEAIAAFFAQAGAFLVELGMAIIGAIQSFLGTVADAIEKVREALAELANWLLELVASALSAALSPVIEAITALAQAYVDTLGLAVSASFSEYDATGTVSQSNLNGIDAALAGPLFAIFLGIAAALVVVSLLFTPYVFLFAAIASLLAVVLVAALWNQGFGQAGSPPSIEPPSLPISPDLTGLVQALEDVFLEPQSAPVRPSAPQFETADGDALACRQGFAFTGFFVGFVRWFLLLYVVGTFGDPSGVGAYLGAFLGSLLSITFGLLGATSADPTVGLLFSILGAVMGAIGIISSIVLLSKVLFQLRVWTPVLFVMGAAGIAISAGGFAVC